ncbi:MAG: D-2-hydroxyacid dehydrogenase [Burkholderiales bacterium]
MTSILVANRDARYFKEKLAAVFPDVEVLAATSKDEARSKASGIDVLAGLPSFFDDELIASASRLKWIQVFTAGVDQILAFKAVKPDHVITSVRGIHGPQMAEMAMMLMLALARDLPRMLRNQQQGQWQRFPQHRLSGKTVVLLGMGASGMELAVRCKALGMVVVGVSRTDRPVPGVDRILARAELLAAAALADYLVVLAPYESSTHGLVNKAVLDAMKPSAFLINIARGAVCDEPALIDALRVRRIAGAALDVFHGEPLSSSSPLWGMDNVIVTPHQAGECDVYNDLILEVFNYNVGCFLEGRLSDMKNPVRR